MKDGLDANRILIDLLTESFGKHDCHFHIIESLNSYVGEFDCFIMCDTWKCELIHRRQRSSQYAMLFCGIDLRVWNRNYSIQQWVSPCSKRTPSRSRDNNRYGGWNRADGVTGVAIEPVCRPSGDSNGLIDFSEMFRVAFLAVSCFGTTLEPSDVERRVHSTTDPNLLMTVYH